MRLIYAIIGGRVSWALSDKLERNFKHYNLDLLADEWVLLNCLWKEDKQSQQSLCTAMLRDKPFVSRLVDKMVARGYVVRLASFDDRRINRVCLAQKGRSIEEKAKFVANKTLKEVLRGLTQEELSVCQESLRLVFNNSKA